MSQKFLVCGAVKLNGKAKADGRPFSFAQLLVLVPAENVNRENFQKQAHGFEVKEMPLSMDALQQFADIKAPQMMELEFTQEFNGQKFQIICTGGKRCVAAAA